MVPCLKLQNITHSANGILLEQKKNSFSLSNSFQIKPTLAKLNPPPLSSAVPATGGIFFPHSTFHSTRFVFVHPQFSQPFLIAFPPPVPTTAPASNGLPTRRNLRVQDWIHAMHTPHGGHTPRLFWLRYLYRQSTKNSRVGQDGRQKVTLRSNSKHINLLTCTGTNTGHGQLEMCLRLWEMKCVQDQVTAHAQCSPPSPDPPTYTTSSITFNFGPWSRNS